MYTISNLINKDQIKHLSFDIRKTIISTAPDFITSNLELIRSQYNDNNLTIEQIKQHMNDMKMYCDGMADNIGADI